MTGALFLLSLSTVNTPILVVALFCMLQSAGQSLANMPVNTWGVNALKNDMIAHATPSRTPAARSPAVCARRSSSRS